MFWCHIITFKCKEVAILNGPQNAILGSDQCVYWKLYFLMIFRHALGMYISILKITSATHL